MDKVIVIVGANGFLGQNLAKFMLAEGWCVRVVARHYSPALEGLDFFQWDGENEGEWMAAFERADVVVNLAGRTVNCRYNEKNKQQIFDSRTRTTELVGRAIGAAKEGPSVWLNSSTATIYRHAEDYAQTDDEGEMGKGFSVEVAKLWEKTFFEAKVPEKVRKVALRSAMVVGNDPGTVHDVLSTLCKLGLGGKMGSGQQMVSWIDILDFCRAILFCIHSESASGAYNVSSPYPVKNIEWMAEFRKINGMNFGLPASKWMLKIGAFFMGTETELILKSRWVIPTRLLKEGFEFKFPKLRESLEKEKVGKKNYKIKQP